MKRTAFATLALSALAFAGCSATPDNLDSSVQNETAAAQATTAISIDFDTDVANLECDFDGGDPENYSVQFDFQGKHWSDAHHIDFWGCQNDRAALGGIHTGVRVQNGTTTTLTLDQGKTTFTAGANDSVTKTTAAISFAMPADAKCQVEQGWFIDFDFDGHAFQTYGADTVDGCNGRLSQVENDGSLPATLTTEIYATYTKRTITTNDGQWSFTSYEQAS